MGVYFLGVEEDSREGCGEVERGVGGVVGTEDEGICELGGGEVWGEEGLVVNVGGVIFGGVHFEGLGGCGILAIGL